MKQRTKRTVFKYVFGYFRCKFVRKLISRKGHTSSSAPQNKKGKGIVTAGSGHPSNENKKGKGNARAGLGEQWDF